jgi:acetyl-CoA acetyltransferase
VEDRWEHRCVITGIGISEIGRNTGTPNVDLAVAAARDAIADAGLSPADIDGITSVGEAPLEAVTRALGLEPAWTGQGASPVGGSFAGVLNACEAVASGSARHALAYRSVAMLGGATIPRDGGSAPASREYSDEMGDLPELMTYHAYSAANWLGMHLRRHMHLYGTTREQLGWIPVNGRRNAALNARAIYRDPITIDDYLNARWISEPLGLLDCDVPVDGACAFVVSRPDTGADTPHGGVGIEAAVRMSTGSWSYRPDYPLMASADAAAELWRRTTLRPADVDVAELYDGFSFLTLAWLEALGFCGRGEGGPFVEGGTRIAPDGALPLNTYGGQLSAGRMHGHWVLHEAVTQLRGDAGDRQVARRDVGIVSTGGGPIATCMLLTRPR